MQSSSRPGLATLLLSRVNLLIIVTGAIIFIVWLSTVRSREGGLADSMTSGEARDAIATAMDKVGDGAEIAEHKDELGTELVEDDDEGDDTETTTFSTLAESTDTSVTTGTTATMPPTTTNK